MNNLLYDGSQFAIALDNVDSERLLRPRKMNMDFIKKFMFVFGPLSSLFDFLTFITRYYVMHLGNGQFQTGWFLESLTTQGLVIFIIRTRRAPFFTSKPRFILTFSTFLVIGIGWALAFLPFGKVFGFQPLPLQAGAAIAVIIGLYLLAVEAVKRVFYRTHGHMEHVR